MLDILNLVITILVLFFVYDFVKSTKLKGAIFLGVLYTVGFLMFFKYEYISLISVAPFNLTLTFLAIYGISGILLGISIYFAQKILNNKVLFTLLGTILIELLYYFLVNIGAEIFKLIFLN